MHRCEMRPLISLVVPVYNDEQYIRECIDSIISQSYGYLEIILVDDGSTDNSGQICDDYASNDSRIKAIHKRNGGVSAARNTGVAAASGAYIMMVDADDVLHQDIVKSLLDAVMNTSDCEAALCRYTTKRAELTSMGVTTVVNPYEAIERTLYQDVFDSSLCAKLLPTHAVKNCPEPEGCRYEDLDTFYRIYENIHGKIACLSAAMYYYRINTDNFISNFTNDRLDVLDVTDRIESHYTNNSALLKAAKDRKFSAHYNMFVLAERAGVKEAVDRCWYVIKQYRLQTLLNPKVRLKNKAGALLSFFGKRTVMLAGKFMYK